MFFEFFGQSRGIRIQANRTADNVVGRGARSPMDFGFAQIEAERRPSPRCLIMLSHGIKRKAWIGIVITEGQFTKNGSLYKIIENESILR